MQRMAVLVFLLTFLAGTTVQSADWAQFRGPNSSGISDGPSPPIEFGPGKNELWSIPMDSGHSSPCVVGDSLFLTTYNQKDKQLAVVCVARADGQVRWSRTVLTDTIETGHPSFNPASSTPASDGERVVAYFGSFGLICFDTGGTRLWDVPMPLAKGYAGNATSPIIVGDRVILYRGNATDHFLLAVDKTTGEEIWKTPQPARFTVSMACAATPVVVGDKLIVHSINAIQAFEIETGELVWQADAATTATSTPVLAGDVAIVATWNQTGEPALLPEYPPFEKLIEEHDKNGDGRIQRKELPRFMVFHRSEGTDAPENGYPLRFRMLDQDGNGEIDEDEWAEWQTQSAERRTAYAHHGVVAIDINSEGAIEAAKIRNLETKSIPEVPSPLYCDGNVYFVKNGGILTCLELKTGKRVYRMRTGGKGTHYASPVIAGGNLFTTSGSGTITVLRLGPDPTILAKNPIGERIYATPAIVDGVIYVRTFETLSAFGTRAAK